MICCKNQIFVFSAVHVFSFTSNADYQVNSLVKHTIVTEQRYVKLEKKPCQYSTESILPYFLSVKMQLFTWYKISICRKMVRFVLIFEAVMFQMTKHVIILKETLKKCMVVHVFTLH